MSLFLLKTTNIHTNNLDPCLFVHLPKTGGTSIRQDNTLNKSWMFDPPRIYKEVQIYCKDGHSKYTIYPPSFAVIRHPVDRLISAYVDFKFLRPRAPLNGPSYNLSHLVRYLEDNILTDNFNRMSNLPHTLEHHISPITHPVHGLKYAKHLISYSLKLEQRVKKYLLGCDLDIRPFGRFRISPESNVPTLSEELINRIKALFVDDLHIYNRAMSNSLND